MALLIRMVARSTDRISGPATLSLNRLGSLQAQSRVRQLLPDPGDMPTITLTQWILHRAEANARPMNLQQWLFPFLPLVVPN